MKAVILLNGEPYKGELPVDGYVYCCDGAYGWARDRIKIDENVGDFDSLCCLPEPPPSEIYPSEKNMTDGEIALDRAVSVGYSEIEIYGGGGKREDHFLGNLHLLFRAKERGVRAALITNYSYIFVAEGKIRLDGFAGRTISIIPFGGNAHIMESSGLKYPLEELELVYGSTRGISNVAERERAHIVSRGTVLILVDREGG